MVVALGCLVLARVTAGGRGDPAAAGSDAWSGARVGLSPRLEPPPGLPPDPAEQALARARAARRAMAGTTGERLAALRRAAVASSLAVAEAHPDRPQGAEGAFRAGELLRAGGDTAGALAAFERAAALGEGTALGARATYEAGHVLRRAGRHAEALDRYEAATADPAADPGRRDLARLWIVHTRLALDRPAEAERLLRRLVHDAVDPVTRVRAHDVLVTLLVERGELAAAVGWLDACKRSVAAASLEETVRGARVRRALEDLACLPPLRDAIARRTAAGTTDR